MDFYEQELRKLVDMGLDIDSARFVGRACYGKLTDSLQVRLDFVTQGTTNRYEAIQATIINKNDGPVDKLTLRFADLLGKKAVDNPYLKEGVIPYIWAHNGKAEWYVYKPTPADFEQLADALNNYLGLFHDLQQGIEQRGYEHGMQGM